MDFTQSVTLGKTGLTVGRLGLGSGYGAPAAAFEEAFDHGCNYFNMSGRTKGMREAIRTLCSQGKRDEIVVSVHNFLHSTLLMEPRLKYTLKSLKIERADVLLLSWHNKPPSRRLIDKALDMKERGLIRFIGMTGHHRKTFPIVAASNELDLFHIRYNAAHRGADTEAFPGMGDSGIVTYTATRWGDMLDQKKMPEGETAASVTDCYRFVLSNQSVHVCMSAPKTLEEMREGLKTLEMGPLDEDELARMKRIGDYVRGKSRSIWARI